MSKHFEFLHAFSEAVFDRLNQLGFEALTEAEQTFVCLLILKGEVDNGGFHQFYYNLSGEFAVENVMALERVGAIKTAELMRKANGLFFNASPPKDRYARLAQLNNFKASDLRRLDKLDDIFYKDADHLEELLFAYVLQNQKQFLKSKNKKRPQKSQSR